VTRLATCNPLSLAPLFARWFVVAVAVVLSVSAPVCSADDPVGAAMKLYEKRRYEQAARMLEDALARLEAEHRAQAQLVLGMIYLRNADLHEALARTAATAELDYLDKLLKTSTEDRSRYARLYLAEALLARGNAAAARRHFEQVRADPGIEGRYQAIASVGLGSVSWAQRDPERARGLWAGAADAARAAPDSGVRGQAGAAEITLARAAAQGRAQLEDVKSLQRVADDASRARELSPRTRRYLIEIYTATGAPDKALAVARAADLGMASYVERFKVVKGTAKSINLYDLALLTDLARLYRELARRQLEQATADARMKPSAEYYLAEVLSGLGGSDEALTYVQAFLARPQAPAQYRERALARQALIAHRQGRRAEAESTWTAMAESSSDPEVLADIVLDCADAQAQCGQVLARVGQVTEAGDGRRYQRLNFALGSYYLRKKDYARAIAYMEAGRDKSNKNKIEANDPEMLAGLAEAYYRTKKFSESLEIFFEMSKEFPVVRQIQEAMQGVYSMEQRSAGDVKIL
jgi:tetratricopeptide (TPR) repeat protein